VSCNDAAPADVYTLSLHDALPIFSGCDLGTQGKAALSGVWRMNLIILVILAVIGVCMFFAVRYCVRNGVGCGECSKCSGGCGSRSEEHTSELQSRENLVCRLLLEK